MRFNTGNPVEPNGSSYPEDLYDNSGIADLFVNGTEASYPNRIGQQQKSIYGMNAEFMEFLLKSGFEPAHLIYVDGTPLPVARPTQLIDRAGIVYRIKMPSSFPAVLSGTWATDAALLTEVGDQPLRSQLASPIGETMIGVQKPWAGAIQTTIDTIFAQTVHINDFPPTPANTWLSRAIDGTPDGGTLQLGTGPYIAKFSKTRSNITILGASMPRKNASKTALIGGTVVQGTFKLAGSSIHIRRVGTDCGQPVCDALNGGAAMDCLVLNDATRADLNGCTVFDCISLAPHGGAAHNFLLEGCVNSHFGNLIANGGLWGVVGKTQRSTINGVKAYGCTEAGFTFKSDTGVAGALCLKSSADNIYVSDDGFSDCKTGILVYAATSSMADVQISNYIVDGCQTPFKTLCDSRAANVNLIQGLQLTNGILNNGTVTGYESFGACNDVQITNQRITGTTSGKSIQVNTDNLGTSFVNCTASIPSGIADTSLNVSIAGRFSIDNFRSIVNGDYASPAGINLVPDSAATFKIGAYLGKIGFSGVQTWTPAFTGLTVVNGTGGVTITGSYVIIGKMIKFRVKIATTGTATTASTASTTFINNLPFPVLQNDSLRAISGTVTQGGVGLVAEGGTNGYTPTWTAYNGTFTIEGQYFFQV